MQNEKCISNFYRLTLGLYLTSWARLFEAWAISSYLSNFFKLKYIAIVHVSNGRAQEIRNRRSQVRNAQLLVLIFFCVLHVHFCLWLCLWLTKIKHTFSDSPKSKKKLSLQNLNFKTFCVNWTSWTCTSMFLTFHHQHLYFLDRKKNRQQCNFFFSWQCTHIHTFLLLVAFTPSLISLLANKIPPFLYARVGIHYIRARLEWHITE